MTVKNQKFEDLSEKFDSAFDDSSSSFNSTNNSLLEIESKKNKIIESSKKPDLTLQDQQFMQNELYKMIADISTVTEVLKNDLKQGSRASSYEAYAKLVNSGRELISELRELNKTIVDINIAQRTPQQQFNTVNNVVVMTGDQMLDKILEARSKSQINAVEAKFDITSEKSPYEK